MRSQPPAKNYKRKCESHFLGDQKQVRCSYNKKWGTSSYAFAPRRKSMVSPSTYRLYLFKEDKLVEWFCSFVITSVISDKNPA